MTHTEACFFRYRDAGLIRNAAIRAGKGDDILLDAYFSPDGTVNEKTLFDLASVTKITATTPLALMAIEEGRLSLDDPVCKFFPCPENKRGMRVRHLLTHTMGIGHRPLNKDGVTYDNVTDYILHIPSDLPFGQDVLYSCPGFILLGKILEQIYGKRIDALFAERVAGPLGMTDTSYLPDRSRAFVNSNIEEENVGVVNDYNCRFLGGVSGNAGLFSNVRDLTVYARVLANSGAPLLRPETFREAARNHTPGKSAARGLGFLYVTPNYRQTGGLLPPGSVGHCGHTGQSLFADPESGLYAVILTDGTVCSQRKYGCEHYDEVQQMRADLHRAVKEDLAE